jgi:tRNA G46 methylase TrmB
MHCKKIIIFGFCHSGTSILKSIIGHCKDVHEIIDETNLINTKNINLNNLNKKFILCKTPFFKEEYLSDKYNDYIKIFIIRNPLWIYSSLNKRYDYNLPDKVSFKRYINILDKFIYYKNNQIQNLHLIKYEELFTDNYKNIKNILNLIGLQYTNDIFKNELYDNNIISSIKDKPIIVPKNNQHELYRTWQINQPFINNNTLDKLNLQQKQIDEIINNNLVNILYPNNKKIDIYQYNNYNKKNNYNNNNMEKTFNKIYETKRWGNTLSGPGSTIKSASNIIPYIIDIIKTKNIKKIVDGSCGDCNWIIEVLKNFPNIKYIGNDVSSFIIEKNKEKFKDNKNYTFVSKNAIVDEIENCDLYIFRHTMMNLKMTDNIKILENIKRNCKYVLLTHHTNLTKNPLDSDRISFYNNGGGFRWQKISLNHAPFDLNPNKYLISTQKESSNNSNELLCLYLINRKNNGYNFEEFLNLPVLINLNNIIKKSNKENKEKLEGNILYEHLSDFEIVYPNSLKRPGFDIKRQNLYNLAKNSKNLLEIGFNGGHSSLLYFYSNPNLKLLSFDIALHKYTEPCVNFLKNFNNIEFIKGDSTITVKNYIPKEKYDIIHIDGGHGIKCAEQDLLNCPKFAHENTILIFDDTNHQLLNNLLEKYIQKNLIKELSYNNIYKKCKYHRLFNYIL